MKRCTGLALLVLLAGCGGDGSPSAPSPTPTPAPINGLAVMVSAAGYLSELTSGGPPGQTCGKLSLVMSFLETRGGTVEAKDYGLVVTDSARARIEWQATFPSYPTPPNTTGSVGVFFDHRCIVMPARWDFRVNTADVSGNVTQLHGSGKIEIR